MRAVLLILAALSALPAAFAQKSDPPQNVIFITFDGVRYRDIYKPEDRDFLKQKNGYPLAHFTNWAINQSKGFRFGSQGPGDEMKVGNTSSWSLPGYKAIFSGVKESQCDDNDCGDAKNETLVDRLYDEFADKKNVALFSSWNKIHNAVEGLKGHRAVQSLGKNPLHNLPVSSATDRAFETWAKAITSTAAKYDHLPPWKNARKDEYTWQIATNYLKTYHPRFTYISLVDTDEWAHADNRQEYFLSLNDYDNKLVQLVQQLQGPQHSDYFKNTSIVITTDHGRGSKSWSFQYHGSQWGWLPDESDRVWSYVIPSQFLRQKYGVFRSGHGARSGYSQLDIRPTIEALLQIRVKKGQNLGQPLILFR